MEKKDFEITLVTLVESVEEFATFGRCKSWSISVKNSPSICENLQMLDQ
jgi:hypothetical protein